MFKYDSNTRTLSLYVNSIFSSSIILNDVEFENTTQISYIATYTSGSTTRYYRGGIRDFATYDKQLSEDEISYIYKTGVPPVSAYSNIQQ